MKNVPEIPTRAMYNAFYKNTASYRTIEEAEEHYLEFVENWKRAVNEASNTGLKK